MYDELVKRLRDLQSITEHCDEQSCDECENRELCDKHDNKTLSGTYKEAVDAIEDLQKQIAKSEADNIDLTGWLVEEHAKHLWIPVAERLPECDLGAEVGNIEWISCGRVYAGCFGRGGKYRDAYFRTWTDAGEGMDAKGADYWRTVTLPEPPEEE